MDELLRFCSETIFQDAPPKFHSALHVALASFDAVRSAHDLIGEALPPEVSALRAVISTSQVTKLEGQLLGCLAELSDNPLKLKREMMRIYDNTPGQVWSGLHAICTDDVERFISVGAKKANIG